MMKKYTFSLSGFLFMVLLFWTAPVCAQYLKVETGTCLKVLSGSDLRASGDMTIVSGGKLDIYGNVNVSGSVTCSDTLGIVVHSTVASDGSFIFESGSPQGTIERYVTYGKWHQVAIPVTGATVNNFYFDKNPSTWLARWNATDSTWGYLTSLTETLPVGEGYDYYIENTDKTVTFSGGFYSGDFQLSSTSVPSLVSAHSGANLVGNPYAAPVQVTDDGIHNWTFTDMEKTVWVLDNTNGAANYKYATTSGGGDLINGIIPMGQAFFVRDTGSSPSFILPAVRRVANSTPFFKSAKVFSHEVDSHFILDVKDENNSSDEIWVTFGKNATHRFDNGYDASKMFGSEEAPQLYMREDSISNNLSIDHLPDLQGTGCVVRVSFIPGMDGKQTFIGHSFRLDGVDVELEDLKTGAFHDFSTDSIYTFQGTKEDSPDRFLLHFGKVSGIVNPDETGNINIYSFGDAVYIHFDNKFQQKKSQIAIYDLMGRMVYKGESQSISTVRIPMALRHTYLVVRVVNQEHQVKISKVYLP